MKTTVPMGENPLDSSEQEGPNGVRTLRLAYLTTQYPAVSHTFIRRELRAIERRGHHVTRLAIRPPDPALVASQDREEAARTVHCLAQPRWRVATAFLRTLLTRPRVFVRALGMTIRMGLRSERGVMRHLAYLVEASYFLPMLQRRRIQHVHVHFGTNAAAVARLIRRLGGPSYSFTVHGPDEFDAARSFDLRGKIEDAAFAVGITDFCAAQLRRWVDYEQWSKIHVIRCAVGDDFFHAAAPVSAESKTLICVGRLCPQKGQLFLIDALHKVVCSGVEGRLVLAGDGEMRAVIEERIKKLGLTDQVEITGWIDEGEVRRRLLASRVLVLPSFAEGLPMVIMEALALGRPVISTYVAGIPELVRPGESGWLIPAGNVERLAEAMQEALTTPPQRLDEMAAVGRKAVLERHNTPVEARRLEQLFIKAVDARPPYPDG